MNPLRSLLRLFRRLHRRALLHRRPLAALAAGGAVLVGLQVAAPPAPASVSVWTAGHDLPSGTVLQRSDLARVRYPPGNVPADVVRDPKEVLGRTLAAPMSRGEVVTSLRTVTRGLLRGYPGMTAVPLRVTDAAVVELLEVGDRVSFVVADPDARRAPRMLLEDAPVVAVPRGQGGAPSNDTPGRLVIAAVPSAEAGQVAAAAAASIVIPVWSR